MRHSSPTFHPPVVRKPEHQAIVREGMRKIAAQYNQGTGRAVASANLATIELPLSTVSLDSNFDATIQTRFTGQDPNIDSTVLTVDSGSSMLVVPYWEAIAAIPGWPKYYTVLADNEQEPFLCPAKIVRGRIEIPMSGGTFVINDCTFYACTADGPNGRTSNFGVGCVTPWSAGMPTPFQPALQAPLSYSPYPFAEFRYDPASIFTTTFVPHLATTSKLILSNTEPPGYQMFSIIPQLEWMSLRPVSLSIAGQATEWPNGPQGISGPETKIAMIDTGGGPVLLSDPHSYLLGQGWPEPSVCPCWTQSANSTNCRCIHAKLEFQLQDDAGSAPYPFAIDTDQLPLPVQGLTLVMCERNEYMEGNYGMNIGGISFLFNDLLIDYAKKRVGFKVK